VRYGCLNRRVGWTLLVAGFAWAIWLDPWSLSERDPASLVGSPRMAARHAQAVLIGMGFLQLMVSRILAMRNFTAPVRRVSGWLTGTGAVLYALGYIVTARCQASIWLVPAGALINFTGFMVLAWANLGPQGRPDLRLVLPIVSLGMLLDCLMGLFIASPQVFLPLYIGPEDGIRLRMLRLARAAVIALSLLTLLYEGMAARGRTQSRAVHWGRIALLLGTIGMPLILTAAAFISVHIKFLLGVPADAIFAGTLVGAWLAGRHASPLELWGWVLMAASLAVGLVMGLYAFDGPWAPPAFLGAYNDFGRRLARLAHAYAIVLGLLCILVARELDAVPQSSRPERMGRPLLVAGAAAILGGLWLHGGLEIPASVLSVGPALVVAAMLLCVGSLEVRAYRSRRMGQLRPQR
jgi:hypothetical protein